MALAAVTGATGFLGRHIVRELVADGDPDQRDHDRAAAELAPAAARKPAAAAAADVDAAGIERIEPHASLPVVRGRKGWTGPANRAWNS